MLPFQDDSALSNLSNAVSVRLSAQSLQPGRKPAAPLVASDHGASASQQRSKGPVAFATPAPGGVGATAASSVAAGSPTVEDGGVGRIAGLCPEDKQKIATLIQQVVKVGGVACCAVTGV